MSTSRNRNRYFLSEYMQVAALTAMEQVALGMGIERGAALVLVKPRRDPDINPKTKIMNSVMVREPVGREVEAVEAGTNYFGVVMGMLAYMLASYQNSGTKKQLHKGEMPYRGGLIRFEMVDFDNWVVCVAFYGGTEDQDVRIAEAGMAMLFSDEAKG